MYNKSHGDKTATGIFLVGLALLFMNPGSFWPGILFVIGASNIARGMAQGQHWANVSGGIGLIGLGIIFTLGFSWPLLLILIGLSMIGGRGVHSWQCSNWDDADEEKPKRKNDEKRKHDDIIVHV